MLNIFDLRKLETPTASVLAHPSGTSSATFQAHSGLMATLSRLLRPDAPNAPSSNFAVYRSTTSTLDLVTAEIVAFAPFEPSADDVRAELYKPYAVFHPLRPFMGIGYGRNCLLRGSGVGKGDDTDSGSYSFLRAQAKWVTC
jgi:regulator-associated protein of mTOR